MKDERRRGQGSADNEEEKNGGNRLVKRGHCESRMQEVLSSNETGLGGLVGSRAPSEVE